MLRKCRVALIALSLVTMRWSGRAIALPLPDDAAAQTLPARLSDREFWQLIQDVSEPDGSFRSDNLLSNELQFQHVVPELVRIAKSGRAYLGVGPEQNFTYIASLRPSIAFIVDIRRGNLDLQLLYKALFELADTRADFVSLLFSKPRPVGLSARSTAKEIFDAYGGVATSERLATETLARVRDRLFTAHRFALSEDDVRGIEYVYRAFATFGPGIKYSPIGLSGGTVQPTYAELMAATDAQGQSLAFLATEDRFSYIKNMEARNLIVPVIGNFAGPKAIGAVGAYLKRNGATVSAFYLSNVEEYLRRDGLWQDFCANVSALPSDATSTFIRSVRASSGEPSDGMKSELGPFSEISHCR
jgi:hypothetical protein